MADENSQAAIDEANKIVRAALDGGLQSWSKSFNRGVVFQYGSTASAPAKTALAAIGEPMVVTSVKWGGERQGKFFVIVPETVAKGAIAFFLSAALGTPADLAGAKLDADGMDAYSELAGALVQQGAQALRGEMKGKIEWTIEKNQVVANLDELSALTGDESFLYGNGQVAIEGVSPSQVFMLLTPSCAGVVPAAEKVAPTAEAPTAVVSAAATPTKPKFTHRNEKLAMKLHLPVIVVLATTKKRVESVHEISPGSIIEFRKFAGEFLDVKAGNTKIADGEVVIVNQHFGVQLRKMNPQIPLASMLKKMS